LGNVYLEDREKDARITLGLILGR